MHCGSSLASTLDMARAWTPSLSQKYTLALTIIHSRGWLKKNLNYGCCYSFSSIGSMGMKFIVVACKVFLITFMSTSSLGILTFEARVDRGVCLKWMLVKDLMNLWMTIRQEAWAIYFKDSPLTCWMISNEFPCTQDFWIPICKEETKP